MEDFTYSAWDSFKLELKTSQKYNWWCKTDDALVWFAAIVAKDVPIKIPAEE